ncbi:ATPase domain-containing protein [Haloparvum sp. PAK95]|uniref:ATPase domain-containing protein n=1 Tax=Haloparvum sp. PAK95 TaxID=3418962 RepID=UPI003D2EA68A
MDSSDSSDGAESAAASDGDADESTAGGAEASTAGEPPAAEPSGTTEEPDATAESGSTADTDESSEAEAVPRCDFCRLPISAAPVVSEHGGVDYEFCSNACREALESSGRVFTTYHGFRQFRPGVSAMDTGLPEGMPRNSLVLLSGMSGTRDESVQAELVWRALQRGEPAVVVSFLETPTSVVQEFVSMDWNVLPLLEAGQLRILDCFTHRIEGADSPPERTNDFTAHLQSVARDATTTVRDPTDLGQVLSRLEDCLGELGMDDEGIVVIDSLTELGTLVQPVKAYDFLKRLRADVCKARFVPVFAGATMAGDANAFPHDLEYMVDGIVDLRFTEEVVPDTLLKQLRIRKMTGVLTIPEWHTYEYTAGKGQVVFDPEEEMEKSDVERSTRAEVTEPDGEDGEGEGEEGAGGSAGVGDETIDDVTSDSGTDENARDVGDETIDEDAAGSGENGDEGK